MDSYPETKQLQNSCSRSSVFLIPLPTMQDRLKQKPILYVRIWKWHVFKVHQRDHLLISNYHRCPFFVLLAYATNLPFQSDQQTQCHLVKVFILKRAFMCECRCDKVSITYAQLFQVYFSYNWCTFCERNKESHLWLTVQNNCWVLKQL